MKRFYVCFLVLLLFSSCKSDSEKQQELIDFACECNQQMKEEKVTSEYCTATYNQIAEKSGLSEEQLGVVGAKVYVCIQEGM